MHKLVGHVWVRCTTREVAFYKKSKFNALPNTIEMFFLETEITITKYFRDI